MQEQEGRKRGADYFPLPGDAYNDRRIKFVRSKFKAEGYAVFVMLLGAICQAADLIIHISPAELELLAHDFEVKPDLVEDVIMECSKFDLLRKSDQDQRPNHFDLSSPYLEELLAPLLARREKDREATRKRVGEHRKRLQQAANVGQQPEGQKKKKSRPEQPPEPAEPIPDIPGLEGIPDKVQKLPVGDTDEPPVPAVKPVKPEQQDLAEKLFEWVKKNCPKVFKMKIPLTVENCLAIVKKYNNNSDREFIKEIFSAMENYTLLLKKSDYAGKTFFAWAKKDYTSYLIRKEKEKKGDGSNPPPNKTYVKE